MTAETGDFLSYVIVSTTHVLIETLSEVSDQPGSHGLPTNLWCREEAGG